MKAVLLLFLTIGLCYCAPRPEKQDEGDSGIPLVSTVNYPLYYFAQRIGGDFIRVEFPAPPNVDPAYWVPEDEALSVYQGSDLILVNGADYAKWMHNVSLPSSRILNTTSLVTEKYIEVTQGASHSHGPGGEHVHKGYAFTTWLDLKLSIAQAEAVKVALTKISPDKGPELEKNYKQLEHELLDLNILLQEYGDQNKGKNHIGSHPVYQYLSKAYGLNIHSVHFEPGESPSEDQWKEFDRLLIEHPSNIMLWEAEPLSEVKEVLIGKGINTVVYNPCGKRPAEGDYLTVLTKNIQSLKNSAGI